MRIGIAFQSNKTPAEYAALARLVDSYAFDVVSVYNDLLFQPALGPLLFMAPHVRRASLGPAALNPYTVHPLEIAGQAAVLDMATQGRAYLGLARGAWLDALGIQTGAPVATLREAMLLVKHLLACDPGAFEGAVFKMAAGATLQYQPLRPSVPITLGTWGPRTARLAGELADEVKVGGSTNPAMARRVREWIALGALAAGRPTDAVGVCLGAVTVVDADREAARRRARHELALYLPVVAGLDVTLDDPEWLEQVHALAAEPEALGRIISDEQLDLFAFAGDPASIVRQVERLAEAGVTRVEFGTPHGASDPAEGVRLLGEQVLPRLTRVDR